MNKTLPTIRGTKEWATTNVNIALGCEHNCRYCYGRTSALRFGRIKNTAEWQKMVIQRNKVEKPYNKRKGTIMFPSTHDITPNILVESIIVLRKMLQSGNRVLIVSKPHLECIKRICEELILYRKQILFRFTIGSHQDDILKFWEPYAPSLEERIASLKYAFENGFATSVSCEPLLSNDVIDLYSMLKPFVTHSIWFGGLNRHEQRVDKTGWGVKEYLFLKKTMEARGTEQVRGYYEVFKYEPLVRWKDSFKEILNLESPDEVGMDI